MFGIDLCRALQAQGDEVCITNSQEMDVRLPQAVQRVFADFAPELVYHLAALTDVDGCERAPIEAYRTNTVGTQNVALACQRTDIPMVYLSTISVFDGSKPEPYTEFDVPNPQSWYSRSKYEGEKIVQQLLRRFYIVRAGWMFGGGVADKKFVAKMIELARTRPEIKVVNDKFGSPTYTCDLSPAVIRLTHTNWYGVYHLVNPGQPCNRYEFARKILEYAHITTCRLIPVSSAEFPLPAPRPRMEAARNLHVELMGLELMRPWEDALKEYIGNLIQSEIVV